MKYRFSRRVQLKRLIGEELAFESAEFSAEADTKAEAEREVLSWINEYISKLKQTIKIIK